MFPNLINPAAPVFVYSIVRKGEGKDVINPNDLPENQSSYEFPSKPNVDQKSPKTLQNQDLKILIESL